MTDADTDLMLMKLERHFDAPRALVFDCMTQVEHLERWWGPRQFDVPFCELDARPGGAIRIDMRGPEPYGVNHVEGEYLEVERPDRLVFALRAFRGEDGHWGIEHVSTMLLEDAPGGGTLMRLTTQVRHADPELIPALRGMKEGWSQSFDKLDELLVELC
jgi:uncharacterized protein YndB with AHSA1/START domain